MSPDSHMKQVQASVALKRIDLFMNRDELDSKVQVEQQNGSNQNGSTSKNGLNEKGSTSKSEKGSTSINGHNEKRKENDENDNAIEIDDASFAWESDQVKCFCSGDLNSD